MNIIIKNQNYYQKLIQQHMTKSNHKNILFTLQLKVFDKLIDVNVCHSDNKKILIERVCKENSIGPQLYGQIQQKILNSLNKLLKSQSVPPSLLEKVLKFLEKGSEDVLQDTPAHILQSPIYPIQHQKELEQQLIKPQIQKPCNPPSHFLNTNYLYQGDERLVTFLNNNTPNYSPRDPPISSTNHQDQIILRTRNINTLTNRNKEKQIKKVNPQNQSKLRAYKNVYNKCKNPEIKEKTKEYIEEITHNHTKAQVKNSQQATYRNRYKENHHEQYQAAKNETSKNYNHTRRNSTYINPPQVSTYKECQSLKKNSLYRNNKIIPSINLSNNDNNFLTPKTQNLTSFYAPQKRISYQTNLYLPSDRTTAIDSTRMYNPQYQCQNTRNNNSFTRTDKYISIAPPTLNNTTTNLRSKSYQRITKYQASGCIRSNRQVTNDRIYQREFTNKIPVCKNIPYNTKITQRSKSLYSLTRKYHYLEEY